MASRRDRLRRARDRSAKLSWTQKFQEWVNANKQLAVPHPFPHRQLFAGEIARTEWEFTLRENEQGQLSDEHLERCPYCKNTDTARVVDRVALEPFVTYYGDTRFKVFSCHCCGGIMHWSTEYNDLLRYDKAA